MRLVADTNAVVASLIKNSSSRKIILSQKFDFFVPDFSFDEINKYTKEICKKADIKEEFFDILLNTVFERINIVPYSEYKGYMKKAIKIMGKTDIKDVPFIACALLLKTDGIWTEDKGFLKQDKIKIWKTRDLIGFV